MTIFRYNIAAALLAVSSASPAQSQATSNAQLLSAARAAIGRLEVRQRNVPGTGETTITKADRLLELPFGPVLITKVSIDEASHAEEGALGIYYLQRTGTGFRVVRKWPRAISGFGWGGAPNWALTREFTSLPAIYSEVGGGNQGIFCGSAWLVELTPNGPVTSDLIRLSVTNPGDYGPRQELNGKIANVRRGVAFEVRASGTARFTEHYIFRKGRFVRVEKESRLEC